MKGAEWEAQLRTVLWEFNYMYLIALKVTQSNAFSWDKDFEMFIIN